MILKDLSIRGFGKFHDKDLSFSDGINVIYGSNEAGKSTIHSFIRAMLYGMERGKGRASRSDFFSHYEPWSTPSVYGGLMRVEKDGHVYRIERNFSKNPKDVTVTDETDGISVPDTRAFFNGLLSGLSETAYQNTISIGQLKSATDSGMVNELKNYIANMNTTGNMALNITRASAFLKDQKKSLVSQLVPEAAKSFAANANEIRQIEAGIASPEYKNTIGTLKEENEDARKSQQEIQAQKEALIEKISAEKQKLKSSGFESRESVLSWRDKANAAKDNLDGAVKKEEKGKKKIWSLVLLILAAVALAVSAYLYIVGPKNVLTLNYGLPWKLSVDIFFGLCIGFFVIEIILAEISASARWKTKKAQKEYDTVMEEHGKDVLPVDTLLSLCDDTDKDTEALSGINASLTSLENRQKETAESIEKQQKSQWELEQQLEHLSNLKDESAALKNTVAENDRLQFEIDSIDLALETMTRLSTSIRDSFGLYLNKEASDLVNGITGGIYHSMSIDENLNVFMNTEEKLVPLEQVSSGTMDQIYLALRLAAANLMQKKENPLPLFFDDSFVNYDEERLGTALKWLSSSIKRQSLIFTCHRREAQLLSANMIPYELKEL